MNRKDHYTSHRTKQGSWRKLLPAIGLVVTLSMQAEGAGAVTAGSAASRAPEMATLTQHQKRTVVGTVIDETGEPVIGQHPREGNSYGHNDRLRRTFFDRSRGLAGHVSHLLHRLQAFGGVGYGGATR